MATNQQVIDSVETLTKTVHLLSDDVKDLEQALTGTVDGKPGVNGRLDTVEGQVDGIKNAEAGRKRITIAAVLAAFTAVITAVIAGIVSHFSGH